MRDLLSVGRRNGKRVEECPRPRIGGKWIVDGEHDAARLLTVNDLYSFDPNLQVELEEFTDIVGRNFRQPKEGLGFDASPSAHMWRTMIWPTKYL